MSAQLEKSIMKKICDNRKVRFNYHIIETYEAGIVLLGSEVKSIRKGSINLNDAYCKNRKGELFLSNSYIAPYDMGGYCNHEPLRERKLLLHKKQINKLIGKITEKGLSIVPLLVYLNEKNIVKIEIALVKGKRLYDKRQTIKERESKVKMDRIKKDWTRQK
jgi:SsrA-binding protein